MLVIIFYFLECLPFVLTLFHLFIVYSFCIPFKVLFVILIRVVYVLLSVVLIVVIKTVTIKCLKENPFQDIPDKENNNGSEY